MKKYLVKSADEFLAEENKKIEKAENDVVFTPTEAAMVLTIMIEDSARWKLREFFLCCEGDVKETMPSNPMGIIEVEQQAEPEELTQSEIDEVVDKVYRSTVKDWRYDSVLLQICRKSKFDITMVRGIVDGVIAKMKAEAESEGVVKSMSKALFRSIERVRHALVVTNADLVKGSVGIDELRETGIPYPERVYAFARYSLKKGGPGSGRHPGYGGRDKADVEDEKEARRVKKDNYDLSIGAGKYASMSTEEREREQKKRSKTYK